MSKAQVLSILRDGINLREVTYGAGVRRSLDSPAIRESVRTLNEVGLDPDVNPEGDMVGFLDMHGGDVYMSDGIGAFLKAENVPPRTITAAKNAARRVEDYLLEGPYRNRQELIDKIHARESQAEGAMLRGHKTTAERHQRMAEELKEELKELDANKPGPPVYQSHVEPGGENYREFVITVNTPSARVELP